MSIVDINKGSRDHYSQLEGTFWQGLEDIIKEMNLPFSEVMKNYPAFMRRRDLPRLLAHYELFKLVKDMPGCIVELGVFLGAGSFTFGKLLETFCPGDRSRLVYGFDSFEGYKDFADNDGEIGSWVGSLIGDKKSDQNLMMKLCELHNLDNMISGVERVRFVPGDVADTVPAFANDVKGTRIALLYFDVNLYTPTKVGLAHLYDLVLPGGVIAFNGFGSPPWEGESKAVEEFLAERELTVELKKFPFSTHPSAYFIKK